MAARASEPCSAEPRSLRPSALLLARLCSACRRPASERAKEEGKRSRGKGRGNREEKRTERKEKVCVSQVLRRNERKEGIIYD